MTSRFQNYFIIDSLVDMLYLVIPLGVLLLMFAMVLPRSVQRSYQNLSAEDAAHLALACYNYKTEHGSYPSGSSSTDAFKKLFPTYLQDPNYLFMTRSGGHKVFTGASINELKRENVCWTLVMNNGNGLTSKDPNNLPLLLSDVGQQYPAFPTGGTLWKPTDKGIWGKDGLTVARLDQSASFLRPKNGLVELTPPDFKAPAGAEYADVAP